MNLLCVTLMVLAAGAGKTTLNISSDPALPVPNLLSNADFEVGSETTPSDWRFTTAVADNFNTPWREDGRSGKCVHVESTSGVMSGYWNQTVKVVPETAYLLTGWFRLESGKLLCFVHGRAPDGRSVDARFYATSMLNSFLVPVFLKREHMVGTDPDQWYPFEISFSTLPAMSYATVSPGMYFQAGAVSYDDFRLVRATTDLHLQVCSETRGIKRVKVFAENGEKPIFDSGAFPAERKVFENTLPGVPTGQRYRLEATLSDGEVLRKAYPEETSQ